VGVEVAADVLGVDRLADIDRAGDESVEVPSSKAASA